MEGARSRYKLIMSKVKVHNAYYTKIQKSRVDFGVTNSKEPYKSQSLHYKDTELSEWTFALQTKSNLIVHNAYKTKIHKISRWTFAVQTYGVLKFDNAYNTKLQNFLG